MNWHDRILREFLPGVHPLTLVEDADGLLGEERVQGWLRNQGFDVVRFDDSVAFRYVHESSFRVRLEQGKATNLVVVFGADVADSLPFDLVQAGHRVALGLHALFPRLSRAVVEAVDPADLGALHAAVDAQRPGVLGDDATKDFVLRHVYGIATESVVEPHDLLRVLLRLHYGRGGIPFPFAERLIEALRQAGRFPDWPLDGIVPDGPSLLAFLQERWPAFVEQAASSEVREGGDSAAVSVRGPAMLPFDHPDVRVYIDNLFLEGHLRPIQHPDGGRLAGKWPQVGIQVPEEAPHSHRLEGLLARTTSTIPDKDARHRDWLGFARTWGELLAVSLDADGGGSRLDDLRGRIDSAFEQWLASRYAGLANLPPAPPVMLHHVARALARELRDGKAEKVALVVVDGLSLDQWVVVRGELEGQRPGYRMQQDAVFAWIPTVTSVSRQAAFAGVPPMYFPNSIQHTASEPSLWQRFWERENVSAPQVGYVKGLGDGGLDEVAALVGRPEKRAVGLVVDTVDKIMHGMALGAPGMHNQVRQWAAEGFLAGLLDLLLEHGFCVYITSDHGNIEARGCGRPGEGAVADMRGERVRVYPDDALRRHWNERFPDATAWPSVGLPEDYRPLLAPGRSAFVRESQRVICHGGGAIEEVIVPLVRIAGRAP